MEEIIIAVISINFSSAYYEPGTIPNTLCSYLTYLSPQPYEVSVSTILQTRKLRLEEEMKLTLI